MERSKANTSIEAKPVARQVTAEFSKLAREFRAAFLRGNRLSIKRAAAPRATSRPWAPSHARSQAAARSLAVHPPSVACKPHRAPCRLWVLRVRFPRHGRAPRTTGQASDDRTWNHVPDVRQHGPRDITDDRTPRLRLGAMDPGKHCPPLPSGRQGLVRKERASVRSRHGIVETGSCFPPRRS